MSRDSLGDRMKMYEGRPRLSLIPKTPVIMRLDGKAFHTLTRNLDRPWDQRFASCMWATAQYLAEHVSGCQLVYTQSDEISLLLTDYETIHTQPWFDYDLQKMVSVTAAMAAVAFSANYLIAFGTGPDTRELPAFDSRAWNIPREEVCNYFIWRQQDATRNSIQMLGRAHFSHKRLHGVSCDRIQGLLLKEKSVNWNDCPSAQKRGVCLARTPTGFLRPGRADENAEQVWAEKRVWTVDQEIPVFTADRKYVDRYVWPELEAGS